MKIILHISYANDGSGGGIYFYLKEYINIQKSQEWIPIGLQ